MNKYLFLLILLASSCTKSLYVYKQAIGQISLEVDAVDNNQILKDKNVDEKIKSKIKNIQKYKRYFYEYFNKKECSIYDQTTFLKQKAVTYLVIASPFDKIDPVKVTFPIVGEFPYLGFFDKEDALEYERKLQKEGFDTFVRPVYAYSTLNQWIFNDNILSSFFVYDDNALAELIFHELTHTIFFIKNEVSFNESFAQYFGERLTEKYYHYNEEKIQSLKEQKNRRVEYAKIISQFAKDMNALYAKEKLSKEKAHKLLKEYYQTKVVQKINAYCNQFNLTQCDKFDANWNNAKLAAYLTYQKDQNIIEKIHLKNKFSLKKLLEFFEKEYKVYVKSQETSFTQYLINKEKL